MDQDTNKNKTQAWGGADEKNQEGNRDKSMNSSGSMRSGKGDSGMDNQYSGTTARASEGAGETSEMDPTSESSRDSRYSDRNESDESIM